MSMLSELNKLIEKLETKKEILNKESEFITIQIQDLKNIIINNSKNRS